VDHSHPEWFPRESRRSEWFHSEWFPRRRWRSNPSGKCTQERLTRGTETTTMRRAAHPSGCARCGAGAGFSAIQYQSLWFSRESRRGTNANAGRTSTSVPSLPLALSLMLSLSLPPSRSLSHGLSPPLPLGLSLAQGPAEGPWLRFAGYGAYEWTTPSGPHYRGRRTRKPHLQENAPP